MAVGEQTVTSAVVAPDVWTPLKGIGMVLREERTSGRVVDASRTPFDGKWLSTLLTQVHKQYPELAIVSWIHHCSFGSLLVFTNYLFC